MVALPNRCQTRLDFHFPMFPKEKKEKPEIKVIKKINDPGEYLSELGDMMAKSQDHQAEGHIGVRCLLESRHLVPHLFNIGVKFLGKDENSS